MKIHKKSHNFFFHHTPTLLEKTRSKTIRQSALSSSTSFKTTIISSLSNALSKDNLSVSRYILDDIDDGSRVKFWQDRWCGETPLAISYPELFRFCKYKKTSVPELMKFTGLMVKDYYSFLGASNDFCFPWKSIWK